MIFTTERLALIAKSSIVLAAGMMCTDAWAQAGKNLAATGSPVRISNQPVTFAVLGAVVTALVGAGGFIWRASKKIADLEHTRALADTNLANSLMTIQKEAATDTQLRIQELRTDMIERITENAHSVKMIQAQVERLQKDLS